MSAVRLPGIALTVLVAGAVATVSPVTAAHGQARPAATARPSAGGSAAPDPRRDAVIARVGDDAITVGEVEDLLNDAPAPVRQAYLAPGRRREFVESLVHTALLAREARRRGLDRQPEVAASVRRILSQRLQQVAVLEAISPASVTDEEVRAYYEAHRTEYQQPEYRRATVAITADRAAAEQFTTAARAARGDMRRIQALVRERSVDTATREHDGDVFYFQRTGQATGGSASVEPALATAVFALARETDVTDPVPVSNGRFAVGVLTGVRPALDRSITDIGVVNSIRGALVRERRSTRERELLEDLRRRYAPEMHPEQLDALRLPASELGNVPAFDPAPTSVRLTAAPSARASASASAPSATAAPSAR